MKKKRNAGRKLVLSMETVRTLTDVSGAYCSNSTLSAQVSLCSGTYESPVRYLPECATPTP